MFSSLPLVVEGRRQFFSSVHVEIDITFDEIHAKFKHYEILTCPAMLKIKKMQTSIR